MKPAGSVRVRPTPASAHPADEPIDVAPGVGELVWLDGRRARVTEADASQSVDVRLERVEEPNRGPAVYEVVVDGWRFELEVEDAARVELLERARRGGGAGSHDGPIEVRAMIPGRVMSVAVAQGDPVTLGQPLVVVEAMKMQNELRAPRDGVVERIAVAVGATIEPGQVVVVLR
jgi:biotin carboxyl carrier protein